MLYIVGTPIGNLDDLTYRAVKTLGSMDVIAAEDTRRSVKILNHLEIKIKLMSYHEHNKRDAGNRILGMLRDGLDVALVTDAGMPCISDPGYELVDMARNEGIEVTVIPGPSAVSSAIALSGMDAGRFVFEGFLPRQGSHRKKRLEFIKNYDCAIIFYEAPHRLKKTIGDLNKLFPKRVLCVLHDITKVHESVIKAPLEQISDLLPETLKGEYVLILEAGEPEVRESAPLAPPEVLLQMAIDEGLTKTAAVKKVCKLTGLPREVVYNIAIDI